MSAAHALKAARAAGINLRLDGKDLMLEASAPPAVEILDLLSRYKPDIVALLRSRRAGWSAKDWQGFFEERAGIAEFDGGLPRPDAEARAFACCAEEWLNRSFARSPPGRRFPRGDGDRLHDTGLPHPIGPTEHVSLHSRCWPAWRAERKAAAVAALAAMGIALPPKFPDDFGKNGSP